MPKPTFSPRYYRDEIRPIFKNRVALHTKYGGTLSVRDAWDWLNVNHIQRDAGIQWGGDPPEILGFTYTTGPLVGAFSMKAIAEKFSAGSKDALLAALFERHPAWYTYRRYLRDREVRRLDGKVATVREFAEAISLYPIPQLGVDTAAYWGYLLPPPYDTKRPPLPAKVVAVRHLRQGDDDSGETEKEVRKLKTLITCCRDLTIVETVTRYQGQ
jgi:hypothetical protein